jgi:hypothetical protein
VPHKYIRLIKNGINKQLITHSHLEIPFSLLRIKNITINASKRCVENIIKIDHKGIKAFNIIILFN